MKAMDTATAKRKGIKLRATIIYRKNGEVLFVRKRNAKWNLPGGQGHPLSVRSPKGRR
jgi:8-oxo-dGTP diphosphatase